jgi:DNA invertase Pin-like site-specific DNA recombinase
MVNWRMTKSAPHSAPQENVVCYYRVSTLRQGESGLGLEAQRESVSRFLASRNAVVVAEYTETESGRKGNRPQLQAALEICRKKKATLIIAKLDRLARNVHFISGLLESGVNFLAVDQPTKDRFMLHIQAAFAEEECRRISIRTKEALAAAKRRGVDIGATGRVLAKKHHAEALAKAKTYLGHVRVARASGAKTTKEMATELNRRGVVSPGGARWHYSNTYKLLRRLEALELAF